jgi:uncharacterized protein YggE
VSPRPLHTVLLLAMLSSLTAATAAHSQQAAPGEEPGIWIGDAGGSLRPVQVASRSFLSQEAEAGAVQLVLSVETFASSAAGALSAARLAVTRVRQALSASGIATANVTSELAYLEPRYRHRILAGSWEGPRRLGFDASYVVSVRGASPMNLGRAVDAAMGAGATRVLSLGPDALP